MSNTIWLLFYTWNHYDQSPQLLGWWRERPTEAELSLVDNLKGRPDLIGNLIKHGDVCDYSDNDWSLEESEEGVT